VSYSYVHREGLCCLRQRSLRQSHSPRSLASLLQCLKEVLFKNHFDIVTKLPSGVIFSDLKRCTTAALPFLFFSGSAPRSNNNIHVFFVMRGAANGVTLSYNMSGSAPKYNIFCTSSALSITLVNGEVCRIYQFHLDA
jgi:hypothetical protein